MPSIVFQEICRQEVEPDGLLFDEKSVRLDDIREDQEYQGKRVLLIAHLGKAKNSVQIYIGFGDIITSETQEVKFPTLLDFPAPKILIYPKETFIAEKFQAMVFIGMVNIRMKDYCDIWILSKRFTFQGDTLIPAIQSTFNRRGTTIPRDIPTSLSNEFASDKSKRFLWNAFLKRSRLMETEVELLEIINSLRDFLMPLLSAIAANASFYQTWIPGGPWQQKGN
jgi:Nucleotidyl transferase AbiEii toxin, Type IV TA system